MAATVHVGTSSTFTTPFNPPSRLKSTNTWKPHTSTRTPRCTLSPHHQNCVHHTRRCVSISLLLFPFLSSPSYAIAGSLFDKYVKRKKLEPLETYVPAVILTQLQIKDIEKSLEVDQPQYTAYRTVLRSGPAASFRANVRAVAQYASDDGKGKTAFDDVDRCLRALDELDSLFLRASRNNPEASAKLMKEKIGIAVSALNSLLQTVPSDVLDKGKAIAEAYRAPESDVAPPEELDQEEFKELESIL